jgi:uncharacterized protein (TIGR00251 family)
MKIKVKVITRSASEEVVEQADGYTVRVKAAPQDGKANAAVIRLLARHFGVSRSAVRIASGLTARNKIVEITAG